MVGNLQTLQKMLWGQTLSLLLSFSFCLGKNGLPVPCSKKTAWTRTCSQMQTLLFAFTICWKDSPLVSCQVQAFGNLVTDSVAAHVSDHGLAIDRKSWHVSLLCGQPSDCFPKGRNRCFSYVSAVPLFLQSSRLVDCPLVKST